MLNSKLATILCSFSQDEMKEFEKFTSTFFTAGRNAQPLLKILKINHPDFNEHNISKENIFKQLYPGQEYNDKSMRAMIVSLTKATEEFLIYKNLSKNDVLRDLILQKELLSRELYKFYKANYLELEAKINKKDISMQERFQLLSIFYEDATNYFGTMNDAQAFSDNLEKFNDSLIKMFILKIFEIEKNEYVIKKYYNLNPEFGLLNSFRENFKLNGFLKESEQKNYESLELNYYLLAALKDMNNSLPLDRARDIFNKLKHTMNVSEKTIIYKHLNDLYVQRYVEGLTDRNEEMYKLLKDMLNEGVININGGEDFDLIIFRNIVLQSFTDADWVESVVIKYGDKLKAEYRDSMIALAYAYINFWRKNFSEAIDYLSKVTNVSVFIKADIKNLSLMIYYELNYFEEAMAMIDSYKHTMSKTKEFSEVFKTTFTNFTTYIQKIFRLREVFDEADATGLLKSVKNNQNVINKFWLVEKIEELIGKGKFFIN